MAGLRKLGLRHNEGLTALPEGLWSLVGLEDLSLLDCNMMVLPEGVVGLAGLRALDLRCNTELTTLPAGLGRLRNLKVLYLVGCPGLAALRGLQRREGLPALLAHLAAQGEPTSQTAVENLRVVSTALKAPSLQPASKIAAARPTRVVARVVGVLSRPELNGTDVLVERRSLSLPALEGVTWDGEGLGRYQVQLKELGERVNLKPQNLILRRARPWWWTGCNRSRS